MKHTKQTDKTALRRIKTLGDRSLSPDDHDDLIRVLTRIEAGVESRNQDEQEDSACKDGACSHASDCAVHNEPAYPAGTCDCGATALVRHCDKCLAVTAIDLDNTPANAEALKLLGQTVRVMDADEVKGMKPERCKC